MNINQLSTYYLFHIVIASLFRAIVYIINPINVAKVKLTKHAWENDYAKEIALTWIETIRLLMGFRSCICLVFAWMTWDFPSNPLEEIQMENNKILTNYNEMIHMMIKLKYLFCVINFILDCYLIYGLFGSYLKHLKFQQNPQDPILKRSALIHQKPLVPLTVQIILFIPGIIYMIWSVLLFLSIV
jgi:hypothetical protein